MRILKELSLKIMYAKGIACSASLYLLYWVDLHERVIELKKVIENQLGFNKKSNYLT